APDQQVVMTRQEMQQMVAEAAAQAVQQVTNSLSWATAMSNTVAGSHQNAEEDESSYGGGGPPHGREMERMAEQLRQLQAKVDGRTERRARGHPFSADVLAAPLPITYKDTNLVFDGTSDPSRHVRTFENMAMLHGYTDPVSCRAFLSTFRGGALDWFQQLPPGSITDFEDFASAVAQEKTYLTLMAMRQGEKESLCKYIARYNQACLEISSAVDEVKAGGLIRSLRVGPYRTSLAKTPAHTYDEVFGVPKVLVSDNGTQFNGKRIRAWCEDMKIEQHFASIAHPQANGQVEVTNRIILNGLKTRLEKASGAWVDELTSVLWAYRTTPRSTTGETLFSMVYGMEALLPVEVEVQSQRSSMYDREQNEHLIMAALDTIEELQEKASADLYALPLVGSDVVLGVQWLEGLGKVTTDYRTGVMEFKFGGRQVTLSTGSEK
ncbi:Unknown protein, partial [Striga hermonthica]